MPRELQDFRVGSSRVPGFGFYLLGGMGHPAVNTSSGKEANEDIHIKVVALIPPRA